MATPGSSKRKRKAPIEVFGDGDGSFFDEWLVTDSETARSGQSSVVFGNRSSSQLSTPTKLAHRSDTTQFNAQSSRSTRMLRTPYFQKRLPSRKSKDSDSDSDDHERGLLSSDEDDDEEDAVARQNRQAKLTSMAVAMRVRGIFDDPKKSKMRRNFLKLIEEQFKKLPNRTPHELVCAIPLRGKRAMSVSGTSDCMPRHVLRAIEKQTKTPTDGSAKNIVEFMAKRRRASMVKFQEESSKDESAETISSIFLDTPKNSLEEAEKDVEAVEELRKRAIEAKIKKEKEPAVRNFMNKIKMRGKKFDESNDPAFPVLQDLHRYTKRTTNRDSERLKTAESNGPHGEECSRGPSTAPATKVESTKKKSQNESSHHLLNHYSSLFEATPKHLKRYFGDQSRQRIFKKYQEVASQRNSFLIPIHVDISGIGPSRTARKMGNESSGRRRYEPSCESYLHSRDAVKTLQKQSSDSGENISSLNIRLNDDRLKKSITSDPRYSLQTKRLKKGREFWQRLKETLRFATEQQRLNNEMTQGKSGEDSRKKIERNIESEKVATAIYSEHVHPAQHFPAEAVRKLKRLESKKWKELEPIESFDSKHTIRGKLPRRLSAPDFKPADFKPQPSPQQKLRKIFGLDQKSTHRRESFVDVVVKAMRRKQRESFQFTTLKYLEGNSKFDNDTGKTGGQLSPRECYLNLCYNWGLPPEPLLIRDKMTTELNLAYYGLGNKRIPTLSAALASGMPMVTSLDLTGNRMTGVNVAELVTAVAVLPNLQKLILNENDVGRLGATALCDLIRFSTKLNHLELIKCGLTNM